ncbi:ATP-dependent RNA helicase DEAH13 isoform X2 [Impatiens glandulifera]|uniref:ATP-dependent RNA helicase DEAH13 isoform X2 n=1 Tax=Impatiens glandulifera TaxID=253017 RepID=UPI001FB06106|nr:ATP-dependent RNA helicase DEAH13 isoform X2 [Impatiens glandulifera]
MSINLNNSSNTITDDSNIIILPPRKKNKAQKKVDDRDKVKLSKSQIRKLKKLQEKEKESLLQESMQTLEKYKIQDDVYSLLSSSRNIGQIESVKEKRRKSVQFSKMGLVQVFAASPSKEKSIGVSIEDENEYAEPIVEEDENEYAQPIVEEEEEKTVMPILLSSSKESSVECAVIEEIEMAVTVQGVDTVKTEIPEQEDIANQPMDVELDIVQKKDTRDITISSEPRVPRIPVVVFVARPKEVEEKRKDLPVVMMEQEIMEAINEHSVVIVCGETGSGKTTQVPQFLYEAGYGSNRHDVCGVIGVTQPRRVAVRATAQRVAFELGVKLGKEVGYQVRHEKKLGDSCRIKFMTDGILLKEVQNDILLKKYSVIILDEAHERSLNTDILIGMLSRIIQLRQSLYKEQQQKIFSGEIISSENQISPLKLVLMSATLREEDFSSEGRIFSRSPPKIDVQARQYPVTIHFSRRSELVDYIGAAYKKVLAIHKKLPPGGILVFVTGRAEVEHLCKILRTASKKILKREGGSTAADSLTKENDEADEPDEYEISDRFGFDEDCDDLDANESKISDYDDTDSEVEDIDTLHGDETLASLKAAFEALAGNTTISPDSTDEKIKVIPEGSVEKKKVVGGMHILPLYAMLRESSQSRVFEEVKEGERLVVVATNVAETSLTIPGIKYVVDTGREKVKNYNPLNGMETYDIQWISKASASQRAGRAGRTEAGHCYRLYSSALFCNHFPEYSNPQISKVPVDGVVLVMKSMGISEVSNFPFPTPPPLSALREAELSLTILEALDGKGKLTSMGKAMAQYPMSPRHSRMLLTVIQIMKRKQFSRARLVLGYAVAAAAGLSLQNPFIMHFEGTNQDNNPKDSSAKGEKSRKKKLKESIKASRAKFANPSSDALTIAYALQRYELSGNRVEFCEENSLHLRTMQEMSSLRQQLLNLLFTKKHSTEEFSWNDGTIDDVDRAWKVPFDKCPLKSNEEELLGQAICAGWADRVARRVRVVSGSEADRKIRAVRYQACKVEETVFLHGWSSVSKLAPEFLVYNELLHTNRPYIHGATSVKPDWLVKYASYFSTFPAPSEDSLPYYNPVADEVYYWVNPIFGPYRWELPLYCSPIKDDETRVRAFAFCLMEGHVLPCMRLVREFMATKPANILKAEGLGLKRIGVLLNKLRSKRRTIDSCAKLRRAWDENPRELYSEILGWFQEGFQDQFEVVWTKMLHEASLNARERFPKRARRV